MSETFEIGELNHCGLLLIESAEGVVNPLVGVLGLCGGFVGFHRTSPAFARVSKCAVALDLPVLTLPSPEAVDGPVPRDAEDPGHEATLGTIVQIHPAPHDVESFLYHFFS